MENKQIKFRLKTEQDAERYRWAVYCHGYQSDQEAGTDMVRLWFEHTEKEFGPPVRPGKPTPEVKVGERMPTKQQKASGIGHYEIGPTKGKKRDDDDRPEPRTRKAVSR